MSPITPPIRFDAPRGTRAIAVVAMLATLAVACGSGDPGSELRSDAARQPVPARAAHAAGPAVTDLGAAAYRDLADTRPGNFMLSPHLLAQELAMVRMGADGSSAREIDELFGVLDLDVLLPALAGADEMIARRTGERRSELRRGMLTVDQGVSLWAQRGTAVDDAYLDDLARHFGRGLHVIDFRSDPETAREALNAWASRSTGGRTEQLVARGRITGETRLVAGASLWLSAPWTHPFDPEGTRDKPFTLLDGRTIDAPTMRLASADGVSHASGDGWEAVELPYLGQELVLLVVVPEPGRFAEIEQSLSHELVTEVRGALRRRPIELSLPRFAFTTELSLRPTLTALGASELFSVDDADLSVLAPTERLALSDVIQTVFLSVDEDGTQASAATVAAEQKMPTTEVVALGVDRPFVFAVIDRPSGLPLLLGRVVDPTS